MDPAASPGAPGRPRTVFDCNVLLQVVLRDTGPAFACLELAEAGTVTLCVSRDTLAEVRAVLMRPALRQKFPALTPSRAEAFLGCLASVSVLVDPVPSRVAFGRDPKDAPYLDLALESGAAYLVSRDRDLLALMEPGDADGRQFLAMAGGLSILDPSAFLRAVRALPPIPEELRPADR